MVHSLQRFQNVVIQQVTGQRTKGLQQEGGHKVEAHVAVPSLVEV